MNIKSLLLGSAAALAVVSGAHAADAIVAAEPEPAEYVKVCDAFGTGYFFIPGTETCLKIGGRVRYDVMAGAAQGADGGWSKLSRVELSVSTAADTEYGPLKTSGILRFNNSNGADSLDINEATISLGGLTVGQTDSLFTTMTGYAGNVIQDGTLVGYGPFDTQMVKYTFDAGNGLSIAASVEHDPNTNNTHDNDYTPFFVGGVAYSNSGNGVSAVVGYDTDNSNAAIKVRGDAKFGMVSAFAMVGYNTDSSVSNHYAPWGGDWAIWAGLSAAVSDKVSINTQVGYDQSKDLEVSANAAFTLASGFTITPEIDYIKAGGGDATWGGILRFDRTF